MVQKTEQNFTKYEKARILGARALQIAMNAPLLIKIKKEDLSVFEREARGKVYIVYALDSSRSMKGSKIDLCKKAGIALAYQAINENDKIGLLVFGSQISN